MTQFNKLIVETNWPEEKRAALFYRGLRDEIKDTLAQIPNRPTELSALVDLVMEIDFRWSERKGEKKKEFRMNVTRFDRTRSEVGRTTGTSSDVEPMQIGAVRGPLSKEETEQRRIKKLCLYCGVGGHFVKECPKRPKFPVKGNAQNHQ